MIFIALAMIVFSLYALSNFGAASIMSLTGDNWGTARIQRVAMGFLYLGMSILHLCLSFILILPFAQPIFLLMFAWNLYLASSLLYTEWKDLKNPDPLAALDELERNNDGN